MAQFAVNQKILMVTGKGGVGKSAVAASTAQRAAKRGMKTLLVEIGDSSYYQHLYKVPVGFAATSIFKNFSISIWSGESCLREYVSYLLKIKRVADLFFNNKVMRTFIKAAPALKELAILGKVTSGVRQWGPPLDYDFIVVDGLSTGHFLALLKAPFGMGELIDSGPMGEQSRGIQEVLKGNSFCQYKVVTLPEELPATEAIDLYKAIQDIVGILPEVICNKIYNAPLDINELSSLVEGPAKSSSETKDFAKYLMNKLERQETQVQFLKNNFSQLKWLPLILTSNSRRVIDELENQLQ